MSRATLNAADAQRLQSVLDSITDESSAQRWAALDQLRYFCDGADTMLLEAIGGKKFGTLAVLLQMLDSDLDDERLDATLQLAQLVDRSFGPDAQLLAELIVTCTILCFLLFWRGLKPSAQPLAASLLVFTAAVPAFNLVGSNLALTAASTFPALLSSGEQLMRHGFGAVDSLQDWPWLVPVGRI